MTPDRPHCSSPAHHNASTGARRRRVVALCCSTLMVATAAAIAMAAGAPTVSAAPVLTYQVTDVGGGVTGTGAAISPNGRFVVVDLGGVWDEFDRTRPGPPTQLNSQGAVLNSVANDGTAAGSVPALSGHLGNGVVAPAGSPSVVVAQSFAGSFGALDAHISGDGTVYGTGSTQPEGAMAVYQLAAPYTGLPTPLSTPSTTTLLAVDAVSATSGEYAGTIATSAISSMV